jgi:hypothetical protein
MVSPNQKATWLRARARVRTQRSCGVLDPMHAVKLRAREPETPRLPIKQQGGPEGERDERQVLHERQWGVVLRCTTDEAAEQKRYIASGGCGGKIADQGEHAAA